ncbi:hypothetical protein G9A89_012410 [Geosiphon pyriformis]|nr:hypothetical protein G9A89_012410 [Geosiphon pyriformis]
MPILWSHQYMLLNYVSNDAFSGVMKEINIDELLLCVNNLLNDKTAELLGISNELWRHCGDEMSIALIKTAQKILSKILSNQISLVCSRFNVLCGNNFLVLKDTSIQLPIFAVGSVMENALEKNRELWLVLQDMHKAYDSIFYDPLLCEIKRHEHLCGYCIDTKFVAKTGHVESVGGRTSFLAAGAFVDNTIWIGSCQSSTQTILDIASGFFVVNDISINNDKTVAIPINQSIKTALFSINNSPISITK